jgi:hypothetical protein
MQRHRCNIEILALEKIMERDDVCNKKFFFIKEKHTYKYDENIEVVYSDVPMIQFSYNGLEIKKRGTQRELCIYYIVFHA